MKRVKLSIVSILSVLLVAGCAQKPESDEATVSQAQDAATVSASAKDYALDTAASQLNWYGFKPTGQHHGTIGITNGSIAVDNGEVVGGNFEMNLNDIDIQDLKGEDRQKLTGHLKSEDFFHIERYPMATFAITDVEKYQSATASANEEKDNMSVVVNKKEVAAHKIASPTHLITGNLTLRDTTLSITFPAQITITDDRVEAEAKFSIDRTQWNVSYNDEGDPVRVAKDKFIYNTVNLWLDIVASKNRSSQPAS